MPPVNYPNNSHSPSWGKKPYTFDAPLVNSRVDPVTIKSNIAGYGGLIHTAMRPYVQSRGIGIEASPYPDGTPVNPLPARRAGNTPKARPYVNPFENWINNAKRVFGVFMPGQRRG